jgi:hypothetical protein
MLVITLTHTHTPPPGQERLAHSADLEGCSIVMMKMSEKIPITLQRLLSLYEFADVAL